MNREKHFHPLAALHLLRKTLLADLTAPLDRNASEQQLPSDVPSQHLVSGLS